MKRNKTKKPNPGMERDRCCAAAAHAKTLGRHEEQGDQNLGLGGSGHLLHATLPYPGRVVLLPVAFLVLPIFGFANADVSWTGITHGELADPVPLGIAADLLLGKPIGVLGFSWAAARVGFEQLPSEVNWLHMLGLSFVCGIGFTMSLFIGTLGFAESLALAEQAKMGVLVVSALSGIIGVALLMALSPGR